MRAYGRAEKPKSHSSPLVEVKSSDCFEDYGTGLCNMLIEYPKSMSLSVESTAREKVVYRPLGYTALTKWKLGLFPPRCNTSQASIPRKEFLCTESPNFPRNTIVQAHSYDGLSFRTAYSEAEHVLNKHLWKVVGLLKKVIDCRSYDWWRFSCYIVLAAIFNSSANCKELM